MQYEKQSKTIIETQIGLGGNQLCLADDDGPQIGRFQFTALPTKMDGVKNVIFDRTGHR